MGKKVRSLEFISQINGFKGKVGHVPMKIIHAQFDVIVENVHTVIRDVLKMRNIGVKVLMRRREDVAGDQDCRQDSFSLEFSL